ncbi:amylo-alpha-1,6-glucosidase [Phosphitispora fastidiosa]|uniref:amylo-alpha-1,6-glucosidase n=1 Tax=Phosphitispora fastidiosa TaxID=2837202 RepID=UPI001E42FD3B|nr:glycogen debranching N-terminal domain-containing protein [Phosphitispora fastidiosa]MBU7008347.1 glycogen debranching enzyme [Phosphitispora fastidiosa]
MEVCNQNIHDELRVSPADIRSSIDVLKEGRMFINTLPGGEIPCDDQGGLGFYFSDTRFLSCLELSVNNTSPVFLSRTLRDSHFSQVEMTNNEFISNDGQQVLLQTVHLRLLRMVKDAYYQRIRVANFGSCSFEVTLSVKLGTDFADIFEVRGTPREKKGTWQGNTLQRHSASINYMGTDNIRRSTLINFSPAPARLREEDCFIIAQYVLRLEPKVKNYIYIKVTPVVEPAAGMPSTACEDSLESGDKDDPETAGKHDLGFTGVARYLIDAYQSWKDECVRITSDNEHFNQMVNVAITDLRALSTVYPGTGAVMEAGIPWYAAPFGRDSLIAAWQALLINPLLARETLRYMARYQGREVNPWRDEQPGKILHEMRYGEMALSGELPHTPYYGSVDSTLWFIILLAEYVRWTGDTDFLGEMSEILENALSWCREFGDMDGDGYIEYLCRSEKGLVNQGWKDSWDGVIHRDGALPEGPIALIEVQAYYYRALLDAAELYQMSGSILKAADLRERADRLRSRFVYDFWTDETGFAVYALDGYKKPLTTIVSNPGHCLFTGILPDGLAVKVIERLMEPDMFSGWGIRTMSADEAPYNPMSYHNGSVWPHDNSIIGYGMRQSGALKELRLLTDTLFEAAQFFDHMRLPELFCGFTRAGKVGPVRYPIACDPQAWSVGSVFLLLRSILGLQCRGNEFYVRSPYLPRSLKILRLENIRVGNGAVSLEFARREDQTYTSVIGTEGMAKVIFEKEV